MTHSSPSTASRSGWTTRPDRLAAGACALTAALFAWLEILGAPQQVTMPAAPYPVTILAAVGGHLAVTVRLPPAVRSAALAVCAAGVLAGCLPEVPHTVLILVVRLADLVTGGVGPFDVAPEWPATAAHLVGVVTVLLLAASWVVDRRRVHHRCLRCGRVDAVPPLTHRHARPRPAVAAVAGCLPYGLLKLGWAFGWTVGLTGRAFDGVTFTSPGFGDTAVLTAVSVVVAGCMGAGRTGRWLRPALVTVGVVGSAMLLPVAAVAAVQMTPVLLGLRTIDDPEIADWAFLVVYGSFLVWGVALASLTLAYWRTTRGICPRHTSQ